MPPVCFSANQGLRLLLSSTDILLLCHAVGTVSCLGHALQHARTKPALLVDARVMRIAKRELTARMRAGPESQATCTSYVPGTQAVFARLLI